MFTYKGYTVWHNAMRKDKPWLVQCGHTILKECATMGAAKGWITKSIKKGLIE